MSIPLCHSIKQEYKALQTLTQEFVSACAKGKSEGDFQHLSPQELRTLQLLKQKLETARDALKNKLFVSPEAAERIMNKDMGEDETKRQFFGPDAIHTAFGIKLQRKDLPPIRWSTQELEEAKERGDYLILRISCIPDQTTHGTGTPLTMQKIAELVQPTLTANNQGKTLFDTSWYTNEPFYTQEKPRSGWALVSKELLSDSTNKDYLQQTDRIVEELQTLYPPTDTRSIARIYHKAIENFRVKRAKIEKLDKDNQWSDVAELLATLDITTFTRHTAPEALYDAMLLRASVNNNKILPNIHTWTSTRSSVEEFVYVGGMGASGVFVDRMEFDGLSNDVGVLFSHRR